jgi:hyaluronate lyase
MVISRRAVLTALPATAATAALWAAPGSRAYGAQGDRSLVIANAVAMLAGTPESNARPEVAPKLAAIDAAARSRLAAMDAAGDGELFAGLPLGTSDPNLNSAFQYLYEIALATRAPGGGLAGDEAARRRVLDGLVWLHDHHYGDQSTGYYGNWFTWEIGISTHVSRTLALLADTVAATHPELPATYVASMDAYLRNGTDGDVDLDSRFHTGANLADITTNRVLQGAVLGDEARVTKAVADQLTVFATIDPYALRHGVTDGFYADGSFIQHASVAYTGSYGVALLARVTQTLKILAGTAHLPDAERRSLIDTVRRWVTDGFAPLIFEGWMMEIVRGRAASRATTSGYEAVAAVVEAVTDLSAETPGEDATALAAYVKHLRGTSRVPLDPSRFVSPVSVARYAAILADDAVPAEDLGPARRHAAFNAMDKTVHRRPGYAFALARSSSRISKYEYMNGENLMPWFQGDGAHYLYLAGQDQTAHLGVDYYTTVSPYGLAGVTAPVERRRSIPELYDGSLWYDNPEAGFTSSSESQNRFVYFPRGTHPYSGGARLGAYGAAGLVQSDDAAYAAQQAGELPGDFVAYRNARATRSWFMFDEEIVLLAADVGDPAGREVTTTLDARIADPSDTIELTGPLRDLRDGTPVTGPAPWLRYANTTLGTAVGYVLLSPARPTVTLEPVTASRRTIRLANPDTQVTKQVFSLTATRASTLAWAIVPNAAPARLRAYAAGPLSVLANTPRLQAVHHAALGLLTANAFTAGTHRAGPLTIDGPASVILRREGGVTELAVADPTTERDTVTVTLRGPRLDLVSADEGVRVRPVPGGTRVEASTHHTYGRTLTARLTNFFRYV